MVLSKKKSPDFYAKACAGQAWRDSRARDRKRRGRERRLLVASAKQWASTKSGDSVRGSRKKSVGNDNERLPWRDNRQVSYLNRKSRALCIYIRFASRMHAAVRIESEFCARRAFFNASSHRRSCCRTPRCVNGTRLCVSERRRGMKGEEEEVSSFVCMRIHCTWTFHYAYRGLADPE